MNQSFLKLIARKLQAQKVVIDYASLRKNPVQGAGSSVFIVNSNIGKLVIHKGQITQYEIQQNTWNKVSVLSKLLERYPRIPSSRVILSGKVGRKYFIVQTLLPGLSAGKRVENGDVVDIWNQRSAKLEKDLEKIIARIHQITVPGGGWVVERQGKATGKYRSWEEFLDREVRGWLKTIARKEANGVLAQNLERFYLDNQASFKIKKSVLVHGDLINPSNILVQNRKVSGVIDWELATAGDPAWEFCFNNQYGLQTYFAQRKLSSIQRKQFRERTKLYEPLFLARVLALISKSEPAYKAYRNRLKKLML